MLEEKTATLDWGIGLTRNEAGAIVFGGLRTAQTLIAAGFLTVFWGLRERNDETGAYIFFPQMSDTKRKILMGVALVLFAAGIAGYGRVLNSAIKPIWTDAGLPAQEASLFYKLAYWFPLTNRTVFWGLTAAWIFCGDRIVDRFSPGYSQTEQFNVMHRWSSITLLVIGLMLPGLGGLRGMKPAII